MHVLESSFILIQKVGPDKIFFSFKPHNVDLMEKILDARVAGNQNLRIELTCKSARGPLFG